MKRITIAICTYNRSENLPGLVEALEQQECSVDMEILFIDNNSTDDTPRVIQELASHSPLAIRYVHEKQQGIPFARNRAIEETLNRDYLLFMDDDELPLTPRMAQAAVDAFEKVHPLCIGGRIDIDLGGHRPRWMTDELLGFYGKIDYGPEPFHIRDASTPIWSGIVAYDTRLFRDNPEIRFDARYNRAGNGVGGGSDAIMFHTLLARNISMMYVPEMGVLHLVEPWRLTRRYFWKLHYSSGKKQGAYELSEYDRLLFGAPAFLYRQAIRQAALFVTSFLTGDRNYVRAGMNFTHELGLIAGYRRRTHAGN